MNTTLNSQASTLSNDVNVNAAELVVGSGPHHGTLSFSASGQFTYTPTDGFFGIDSFSYIGRHPINTQFGMLEIRTEPATVAIHVAPPQANDDFYLLLSGQTLVVYAPGLLDNDHNANAVILVSGPSLGSLNLSVDGSFTYTPQPGFVGVITFTYKALRTSTGEESEGATVTINISDE